MNPYTTTHKQLSDYQLFKIIEESHKYDALAVTAAREEIEKRELTTETVAVIEDQLSRKREKKHRIAQKSKAVKDEFSTIVDAVHPIQKQPARADSKIIVIAVFSLLISLSSWFKDYYLWKSIWKWEYVGWYIMEPFMNMLLLPVAAFLFYKRFQAGWILMVFFYLRAFFMGVFYIAYMFEMPDAIYYLMSLAFSIVYAVVTWVLLQNEIKNIYQIDRNMSKLVTTISILVSFIFLIVTILDI